MESLSSASDARRPKVNAGLGVAAIGLRAQAEMRRAMQGLEECGVPSLVLWGPGVRSRLHGPAEAHLCDEAHILVPETESMRAQELLKSWDWRLQSGNSASWSRRRAAMFSKDAFRMLLQWGVDPSPMLARLLKPLERQLWLRTRTGLDGTTEPDDEALFVYLAAVGVGRAGRSLHDLAASAERVNDWNETCRIATNARVESLLEERSTDLDRTSSVSRAEPCATVTASWADRALRATNRTRRVREALLEAHALGRAGYGFLGIRNARSVRFADIELLVAGGVFEPRTVTEQLVRRALEEMKGVANPIVVEVGTGSGAVALSIARSRPDASVHAVDLSARAVQCARRNRRRLGLSGARFYQGNLLEPIPNELRGRVHVLVSNMPYVERWSFDAERSGIEPSKTFFGSDADGLGFMRSLAPDVRGFLRSGAPWVYQVGDHQWELLAPMLSALGYDPRPPERRDPGYAITAWARWPITDRNVVES